ncbi:substrate-binding periplasmic protein [Chromobacterium aquaticum]|uniref:Substrate-binding periplasmic protein n=1 Tax=Chromobacterium aquaticum TaxID=467180 RepID=A0ABV8ZRV6_9NEIS|nr:transporter substrate-binding domain-containing protein [Chromobacterium aquaticum]MCD5360465.1 transporter substrate-binding domain-containing protein [Chromobacterium aquaticum]
MIASLRRLGLVLLLGASLSAPCRAQDGDVLTVAVDANAPPFMYQEHDKIDGLYPLLVSAVCDRAGMACGLRALAWRRAMFELDRSAMAAAGIYKTASRAQRYDFSLPLYQEHVVVVYLRQHPLDFRGLPDLDHKRIGVMAGWSYGDEFDNARAERLFKAYDGDSDAQNLQLLLRGNLDAVLMLQEGIDAKLQSGAYAGLAVAPVILASKATYLAINKASPQLPLLQRFNQALEKMREDGSYQQLIKQFFSSRGHKP